MFLSSFFLIFFTTNQTEEFGVSFKKEKKMKKKDPFPTTVKWSLTFIQPHLPH